MRKIYLLPVLIMMIFSGCSETRTDSSSGELFAMDTYMSIKAGGKNSEEAVYQSESEIIRLDKLFSATDSGSDIYRINHSESAEVSSDTLKIISESLKICESTGGSLDMTVYPIVKLWGFTTGEYRIPENNEIQNCLKSVNYNNINISGNSVSVPSGCELDLGAVAKGYTSDRIVEIFREKDIESGVINLGGNVYIYGSEREVSVRNPFYPDEIIGTLEISDKAVVTSGSYERFFTGNDGKKYCHIIDPATGYPVDNGLVSVTVIGESGIYCDALSTALFVMGIDKAVEYWKNNGNFDMILIDNNHKIYVTEDIDFKSTGNSEIIKIEQKD